MQTKTTDNATAHEQRSRTYAGARGAFWGAALTALLVTGWTMAASRSPETSSGVSPVDLYLAHGGIGLEWLLTPTDGGAIPTVGLAPGTTVTATIPAGSQVQISNGLDAGPMGTAGNPIVNTPTGPGSSLAAPGYAVEMAMKPDGGAAVPLQLGPNGATTVELAAGSPGTVYTNPEYMVCQQADGGVPHFVQDNVSSIASPGAQVQEFVNLDGGTTAVSPTQGLPIQFQANSSATGTITANGGAVQITFPAGCATAVVQVGSTAFTGTLAVQVYSDAAATWATTNTTTGTATGASFTAAGLYAFSCAGYSHGQVVATAWTPFDASQGVATITITATTAGHGPLAYTVNTTPATGSPGSSTTYPMATENELVAPDGGLVPGRGTANGRKLVYVDTMCFDSSAGFELDSASIGPMGSVSLVGNQDYLITTSDPSGDQGAVACWNRGTPIPSVDAGAAMADAGAMCFTLPKVIANSILKRAFAPNAPAYDAGTLNGTATLYFFATVSSGLAITLTPQVPCF